MALQPCCADAPDAKHSFGHTMEREMLVTTNHVHDDDDDEDLEDCDLSCFLESTLFTFDDLGTKSSLPALLPSSLDAPLAMSRPLSYESLLPSAKEPLELTPAKSSVDEVTSKGPDRALADVLPKSPKAERSHCKSKNKRSTSSASSPSRTKKPGLSSLSSSSRGKLTTVSGRSGEDDGPGSLLPSGNLCYPHSCRKCYNDCMNKLLTLCDSPEAMTFSNALRQPYKGTKLRKKAESVDSEAYMVDVGSREPTATDTVVQLYSIDTHSVSKVYCVVFSSRKLSDLHMGLTNKTYGFRTIRRIVFVVDTLPENFAKAYDAYAQKHSRCYQPHPDMRPKEQHYLLVESDYCGPSVLHSKLKPAQAISIIGQVACTLAVAERELQFEHRNLLEENIRVLPCTSKNHHFLIDGRTCCVKGSGIKVTLIDDNFGRMTYNDEVILRMRNYNCIYKDKTAQYLTLERIIKNRWDLFHPETNAVWLAYVCGHLSDYLTVPNPSGDWQRRLELLAFMQRDLHRFRSADEFVWNYITRIGHVHEDHGYQPHTWESRTTSSRPIYTGLLRMLRWRDKKKDSDPEPSTSARAPHGGASSAPAELDRPRPH
ncbi:serine/threonine-protein kinase haspin homolog isoform X2 [Dermacentor albipictus]|uniref:serine/threonine-protein kinase haspin homolog isoform X2 n=1 Tax=Dermacentor albipictus TaxID=60249 RepID=UPI0038FC6D42